RRGGRRGARTPLGAGARGHRPARCRARTRLHHGPAHERHVTPGPGRLPGARATGSFLSTEGLLAWAQRIGLFLLTHLPVLLTISILVQLLGLNRGFGAAGINYGELMVFCLVWGMGGSLISLALSRVMAKRMMGVQVIDPNTRDPQERAIVEMVHNLARSARLP